MICKRCDKQIVGKVYYLTDKPKIPLCQACKHLIVKHRRMVFARIVREMGLEETVYRDQNLH